jgi:hypothetical protein
MVAKNNRNVDDGTVGVEKSVEARENLMSVVVEMRRE